MSSDVPGNTIHSFSSDYLEETYTLEWIIPNCSKMKYTQILEFSTKAGSWKLELDHQGVWLIRCLAGNEPIFVASESSFKTDVQKKSFIFREFGDRQEVFCFPTIVATALQLEQEVTCEFDHLDCKGDIFNFLCALKLSGHTMAREKNVFQ